MAVAVQQLNLRLPEGIISDLNWIAQEEQVDRTSVVRKLLNDSIKRWRLNHALTLYEQGQITKGRAAEMADVSIYDVLDELRLRGRVSNYTLDDLQEDLTDLLVEKK